MKSIGKSGYLGVSEDWAMSGATPACLVSLVSAGEGVLERLRKASRSQRLLFRMAVCDLLRLAKRYVTYRELGRLLGLQITVLSRYVKGHVLPDVERSVEIWLKLGSMYGLRDVLVELGLKPNGVVDVSSILGDPVSLRFVATDCVLKYAGHRVTKVLTAATGGASLATVVSMTLMVPMVVAKDHMDVGVDGFLEVVRGAVGERLDLLYIPEGSIKKGDSVLIVDDVVRSGRTVDALAELVSHVKAEVAGVYCLVGFKQGLERLRGRGLRVEAAMEVVG